MDKSLKRFSDDRLIILLGYPRSTSLVMNYPLEDHISMEESVQNNHWKRMIEQKVLEDIR